MQLSYWTLATNKAKDHQTQSSIASFVTHVLSGKRDIKSLLTYLHYKNLRNYICLTRL